MTDEGYSVYVKDRIVWEKAQDNVVWKDMLHLMGQSYFRNEAFGTFSYQNPFI